jgi:hypothetical protein
MSERYGFSSICDQGRRGIRMQMGDSVQMLGERAATRAKHNLANMGKGFRPSAGQRASRRSIQGGQG